MPKFKTGDTVEYIGTSSGVEGNTSFGGAGWRLGLTFKIDHKNIKGDICWPVGGGNGVYENHLKLIKSVPIRDTIKSAIEEAVKIIRNG